MENTDVGGSDLCVVVPPFFVASITSSLPRLISICLYMSKIRSYFVKKSVPNIGEVTSAMQNS